MTQPSLFDPATEASENRIGAFRKRGPNFKRWDRGKRTEQEAAESIYPRSGTTRYNVLLQIVNAGTYGRTDYEVSEALLMLRGSASKRRGELEQSGLVEDSGRRRKTDSGVNAIVWIATAEGLRAVRRSA